MQSIQANGRLRHLPQDAFLVSKTDPSSKIYYANSAFCDVSCYELDELIGKPHNVIRHPEMPRGVYNLMWEHLKTEEEFFGYVKNLAADGCAYWTFANITPDYQDGQLVGYTSVRRSPQEKALEVVDAVYREMLAVEQQYSGREEQLVHSSAVLWQKINKEYNSYAEYILAL